MDTLIRSLSTNGHFRAYALDTTETVREAQQLHDTMPTSTVALGRTLIAAQILGSLEKGDSSITVKVLGDGALGSIIAVANAEGDVKGYVHNPDLDYKRASTGEVLVAPLVGAGRFVVIKDLGLRTPYTGQVDLLTGEIGDDLAWYFLSSEQTPSSVGLTVRLDENTDTVKVAGGFLLQALPGATDEEISKMEANIKALPALSEVLLREKPLETLLAAIYGEMPYQLLSSSPLRFHCDCSRERFARGLQSLGTKELTTMIEEDQGAEIICQFCGNQYLFSAKELNDLILGLEED